MTTTLKHRIETELLPFVQRPMRYAGGELNAVGKTLSDVAVHGVLCFPDLYDIGMSHTGIQILYHIVNKHPAWTLSRCFHPWKDAETILREKGIPLYDLEYFTPVAEADFIGFTVQYELQFTNIVNMIDLAGLHPLREKRSDRDPLIIAGGPCVGNPEPLADFIDAFVIGDGEEALVSIVEAIELAKSSGLSRRQLLTDLAKIDGVYIPALHECVSDGRFIIARNTAGTGRLSPAKIATLDEAHYPLKPVVPLIEITHKRLAVEVMRGCTRGCRFCSAGMYYRPVRERSPQAVCSQIRNGIGSTGWDEIGLLSLSTADYSGLVPLLGSLESIEREGHISCSLPSTRLDALTAQQLDLLDRVSPISSFTIAPEAGNERLRGIINKDFSDEVIYRAVDELMRRNVQTLKLYFMLGLPGEQHEDILAIIKMVTEIASRVRGASKRRMVHVSLSPFSPKSHTPFQWEKMEDPQTLLEKGIFIKRSLGGCKNVKVSYRDPLQTVLETVMARGDRRVSHLVYKTWEAGARFDGWDECFDFDRWKTVAASMSLDMNNYLDAIDPEQQLPWAQVSTGVSDAFLKSERMKALAGTATQDCRGGTCSACGVCTPVLQPSILFPDGSAGAAVELPAQNSGKSAEKPDAATRLLRFHYKKEDKMRFLGHLDMVAVVHRAARMAEFPVVYSNGFNPHPRISFGPPLPFGASGAHESFDVLVRAGETFEPLSINRWLPPGIVITTCDEIDRACTSLNAAVMYSRYQFIVEGECDAAALDRNVASLMASDTVMISVEKKGATIDKNIRTGVVSCDVTVQGKSLVAVLLMNGNGSCKPSELLSVLLPATMKSAMVVRLECLDRNFQVI